MNFIRQFYFAAVRWFVSFFFLHSFRFVSFHSFVCWLDCFRTFIVQCLLWYLFCVEHISMNKRKIVDRFHYCCRWEWVPFLKYIILYLFILFCFLILFFLFFDGFLLTDCWRRISVGQQLETSVTLHSVCALRSGKCSFLFMIYRFSNRNFAIYFLIQRSMSYPFLVLAVVLHPSIFISSKTINSMRNELL